MGRPLTTLRVQHQSRYMYVKVFEHRCDGEFTIIWRMQWRREFNAIKIRIHENVCILTPATWQLLSASLSSNHHQMHHRHILQFETTELDKRSLQKSSIAKKGVLPRSEREGCWMEMVTMKKIWLSVLIWIGSWSAGQVEPQIDLQGNVSLAFVVAASDSCGAWCSDRLLVCQMFP